jgi:hypothetical protein
VILSQDQPPNQGIPGVPIDFRDPGILEVEKASETIFFSFSFTDEETEIQ